MAPSRPRPSRAALSGPIPVEHARAGGRVLAAVLCEGRGAPDAPPTAAPAGIACRDGCGACCIAPSISSPIPGMPRGKPAGVACVQLDDALRCRLFGQPERPAVCASLRPNSEMCGTSRKHALAHLHALERATNPG